MDNTDEALAVKVVEALEVNLVLGQIIGSNLPFDVWYRKRLQELYSVNMTGYEQFAQTQPPASKSRSIF